MPNLPPRTQNPDGTVTIHITKLRRLIIATGKPQYVTAGQAGISPFVLSLYVQGKKDITVVHAKALCRVLDVELDDLIGWETYTLDDQSESSDRKTV